MTSAISSERLFLVKPASSGPRAVYTYGILLNEDRDIEDAFRPILFEEMDPQVHSNDLGYTCQ